MADYSIQQPQTPATPVSIESTKATQLAPLEQKTDGVRKEAITSNEERSGKLEFINASVISIKKLSGKVKTTLSPKFSPVSKKVSNVCTDVKMLSIDIEFGLKALRREVKWKLQDASEDAHTKWRNSKTKEKLTSAKEWLENNATPLKDTVGEKLTSAKEWLEDNATPLKETMGQKIGSAEGRATQVFNSVASFIQASLTTTTSQSVHQLAQQHLTPTIEEQKPAPEPPVEENLSKTQSDSLDVSESPSSPRKEETIEVSQPEVKKAAQQEPTEKVSITEFEAGVDISHAPVSLQKFPSDLYQLGKEFNTLRDNFLLTYRWYTDTPGLLEQLNNDFQKAELQGDDRKKIGVILVLQNWLKNPMINQQEYLENKEIEGQIQKLLDQVKNETNFIFQDYHSESEKMFTQAKEAAKEPKKTDINVRPASLYRTKTEKPTISDPATFVKGVILEQAGKKLIIEDDKIVDVTKKGMMKSSTKDKRYEANVATFEKDLSLWGQHLMSNIEVSELANAGWDKGKTNQQTSPNILKMIDESTNITNFVIFSILDQGHVSAGKQISMAANTIEYFIDVAEKALENKNYFAFAAIIGALGHSSIGRMAKVWKHVSPDSQKKAEEYQEFLLQNFKKLRSSMPDVDHREGATPCLMMHLKDIFMVKEVKPTHMDSGALDLTTMEQLSSLTKEIMSFKSKASLSQNFTVNPEQLSQYKTLVSKAENQQLTSNAIDSKAYELSLALNPRPQPKTKTIFRSKST